MSTVVHQTMAKPGLNGATRWSDTANILLGTWLVVSPWILGIPLEGGPSINVYLAGFFIASVAAFALWYHARWMEWALAGAGAWLIVSPWALGYASPATPATYNAVLAGLAVLGAASWALMNVRTPARTHTPRAPDAERKTNVTRMPRATRAPRKKAA